jgi:hypothetical protein
VHGAAAEYEVPSLNVAPVGATHLVPDRARKIDQGPRQRDLEHRQRERQARCAERPPDKPFQEKAERVASVLRVAIMRSRCRRNLTI